MLNPVNHGRTAADVARYKTEPYVMAGDVYARAPHAGRGGWSWYTGSAGWMYRAGLESILGLRRRGDDVRHRSVHSLVVARVPDHLAVPRRRYEITVSNPARRCRGVVTATLDGAPVDAAAIPLVNDGRTHEVRVVLGDPAPRRVHDAAGPRADADAVHAAAHRTSRFATKTGAACINTPYAIHITAPNIWMRRIAFGVLQKYDPTNTNVAAQPR